MSTPALRGGKEDLRILLKARQLTGLGWRELIAPVLCGTATMLASIALTVVSAWLITKAWQQPFVMEVMVAVTAVRALGISRAVMRYVERLVSHRLALRAAARTRANAYRILALSPPQRVLSLGTGALLTRLGEDIEEVSDVIVRAVVPAGTAVVTGLVTVAFAVAVSPATAVGLAAAGLIGPALAARSARRAEALRTGATTRFAAACDQVLSGSAALRIRGELPVALANAHEAAAEQEQATERTAPGQAWASAVANLAHGLTATAVLLVAGWQYLSGSHCPQWLGVLVLLALAAFEAVFALDDAAVTVTRAAHAARRLADIEGTGSGAVDAEQASPRAEDESRTTAGTIAGAAQVEVEAQPRVRARDITVGFDSDVATFDLDLPFGTFQEIVAPSGYGKTTLMLTLAGLLPARRGAVTIGGVDVTALDPKARADTVLFVAEDAHIFATTVRDNLALSAPAATDEEMNEALAAVGLAKWVAGLPSGLATVLTRGSASLSGGQRRRLLLARAAVHGTRVVARRAYRAPGSGKRPAGVSHTVVWESAWR